MRRLLLVTATILGIVVDLIVGCITAVLVFGGTARVLQEVLISSDCDDPCDGPVGLTLLAGLGLGAAWFVAYGLLSVVIGWTPGALLRRLITRFSSNGDIPRV